ncbi:selenium metabolism-associated LysR family transcriptional regulator [Thermodesulforhabdus norvegica]|uniref:DNA-binding transcriptional regulator, LysR family n=1 Tax=Thermodesulforhabdus norvegica TaxID=39841 RepID=A0A1I4SAE9_9BACT|nr:selenium metabolism-associated LysR family transcriptional regulator [Thermodesulforhabdus norvegica]SFM61270.1 DNA-binding transcriptional regulator, LysR family [Thermodesulforhabdus norvegica]
MESLLDLHRMEIFCKVVELKSFTRAAESMYLSQPTVSEHIRYLEEILGEPLLDRMGREVQPTQAGRIFYDYARRMLRLREQMVQALRDHRGTVSGKIYLGASTIPGTYILPELIAGFRLQFPDVTVSLKIGGSRAVVDMILNGEIEIGFTGARWNDPKLEWDEFCLDEIVLAVPKDSPFGKDEEISGEDLSRIPLIVREPGSGTRKMAEEILKSHGISTDSFRVVAELGSTEAVKQGIRAGLGGSFISRFALKDGGDVGEIVPLRIKGLRLLRPFYFVRRKKRHLSPAARMFVSFIEENKKARNFCLSGKEEKG